MIPNIEGKCNNISEDWKCPHYGNNQDCSHNEEKLKHSLKRLAKQNIIKKSGEYWHLLQ